ncbi:hypothetical protein KF913_21140 [Candidatus Obscuribacterales bacterium]|nr:hypothetical protein [Candidatus Obscuribacterales bacterium]
MDKVARLQLFYKRLQAEPPASTHDDAYALLCQILNAVEYEHSGVPNNPDNWENDGRLYPPQKDMAREVPGFPGLIRYRNLGHNTYIASNGAIEIEMVGTNNLVVFTKPGADGKGIRK